MKQIGWAKAAKIVLPAAGAVAAFCVGVGCAFGGVFGPLTGAAGGQPAAMDAVQTVQGTAPDATLPGEPNAAQTDDVHVRINNGMVEWTTGDGWRSAGTLEALSAADPYAPPAVWEAYPSPQAVLESGGDALPPQLSFAAAAVPVYRPVRAPAAAGGSAAAAPSGGGGGAPAAPPSGGGGEPAAPSGGDGEDIGWSSDVLD